MGAFSFEHPTTIQYREADNPCDMMGAFQRQGQMKCQLELDSGQKEPALDMAFCSLWSRTAEVMAWRSISVVWLSTLFTLGTFLAKYRHFHK